MPSFAVALRDASRAQRQSGFECADERRLADARVARHERRAAGDERTHRVEPRAVERREVDDAVARAFVGGVEGRRGFGVGRSEVVFGQQDRRGDLVGFARRQKAVEEFGDRHGLRERGHEQCLIDVRGDDVRLFREVRGAPDDVVAARQDAFDHPLSVAAFGADHLVAHDDRIGRADAFEADAAADAAGDRAPFVQHVVPAPRGTGDDSSDLGAHAFCSFSVVSGFSAGSSRSGRGRYSRAYSPSEGKILSATHITGA